MKKIKIYLILFFKILFYNIVYSQSCEIKIYGEVFDLHDKSPIIGALITLKGADFFSQTNFDGKYVIEGICPGKYRLIVSHPECPSLEKTVTIEKDQKLNFDLEHHIDELEEVILSDKRISKIRKTVQEVSLDINQINSYGSNTLVEALNSIPGASALKTGNAIAKPIIHGMYGSRVGIITDDFRQYDQQWGPDHAPTLDFDSYENLQLIKGAAALKYGGDIPGGLIILSSKRRKLKDTLFGRTNINFESNGKGGKITSMLEKDYSNGFFFRSQFTAKRYGDFNSPNYILSNTGIKEGNFSFFLGNDKIFKGWNLNYSNFNTETAILKAAHIGNIQDLFYAINANIPGIVNPFTYELEAPKQRGNHQKISFKFFSLLKNKSKVEIGYNYQLNRRKEFDIRRGGRTEIPAIDLLLQTHNLISSLSAIKFRDWNFEIGFNGILQDNFSNPNTGIKRLIPDYLKYEAGLYLLGNFQKVNSFIWEWGLRADYVLIDAKKYYSKNKWEASGYSDIFSLYEMKIVGNQILTNPKLNFFNISAQTGFSTKISEYTELNTSYILSQRAPNPSELFSEGLHHSLAVIEYGNLNLSKETSHKILLSLSHSNQKFNYGIEPYVSKVFDYIFIEPVDLEQTIRGAFPVWSYHSTNIFLSGIDINSSINPISNLNLELGASYTYSQDLKNQKPVILIPPFNTFQKIKYNSRNGYWDFQILHYLTAKQNRFPNSNFEFNIIENGKLVEKVVDISETPKGYNKLDAILSFQLSKNDKKQSQIRFIIQNITNTNYRDYLNRMRFYSSEIGRNIQLQLNFRY